MEKRSQRIDINKNNTSKAEIEQSQEDRKKILDVEEKNLTEEDDKNAADIGEEGNLIWPIPFVFCQIFGNNMIIIFSLTAVLLGKRSSWI